jgi:nicotinate phosphoribosyltransferase
MQARIDPTRSILLTDLYQLTMLAGYFERGLTEKAVFELFVRDLPKDRGFYVTAGLEQLLDFLEEARFAPEDLDWLAASGRFSRDFVDWLADWSFAGDVHALPEGTVCFPNEPLVRVTAPMPQAQLVESRLINILHLQTLIASKAARCRLAAPDKLLVDFGMRRAHGAEAGLLAARASYIAGFAGSATVLADRLWGIPSFGTMAHSFIEAHDIEADAFEHFALAQPKNVVLLVDTYDTEAGAGKVAALAPRLAERGISVKAVRLDSGDLDAHSRRVRAIWTSMIWSACVSVAPPSTVSVSGPSSTPRRMHPTWIVPTSCRSTGGWPGASAPRARPPGRGASRCTEPPVRMAASPGTS